MKQFTLILLSIIWLSAEGFAQTDICFSYDAAGNRIQQKLCCTACLPPPPNAGAAERNQVPVSADSVKLVIVPNPNSGVFRLSAEGIPVAAQVNILDITGAILISRHLDDGHFDISAYPSGTYVIWVAYGSTRKTILFEKNSQ